ncbi:SAM-dependent methyltransferase [Planococcus lenghuensis]|uniref:SAM-dependent methyltransferase n=2 Tax=Planococcus lenghuensis TaxID=2213202 RepID=A0A1Q2L2D4_9BACL|nr:SAM-dependent methyltransferase [Planococcus lenghuensis]
MEKTAKEKVKHVFGRNADKYVTSDSHAKGTDLPLLAEWLQPAKTAVALDVATGGGHVAKALAPHTALVLATDLTEKMLDNTAKYLRSSFDNVMFVIADAESLPFLQDTFDIVTCRIAPHHFPNPDRFIAETARVLKPGGKFLMIDNVAPNDPALGAFMNQTEKLRDDSHVRCLSKDEWTELFTANGLMITKALDRKKTFDYPVWVARTAENDDQIGRVTEHLLGADPVAMDYFAITGQGDAIQKLVIDEWMVMCEKQLK